MAERPLPSRFAGLTATVGCQRRSGQAQYQADAAPSAGAGARMHRQASDRADHWPDAENPGAQGRMPQVRRTDPARGPRAAATNRSATVWAGLTQSLRPVGPLCRVEPCSRVKWNGRCLHRAMNGSEQKRWMQILLERAREVGQNGEVPVSAVILDAEGRCIGHGRNRRELHRDPLGHAELVACVRHPCCRGTGGSTAAP